MSDPVTENSEIIRLRPRLQNPDAGMRRIALIELADLEEADALPWLTRALGTDEDGDVRSEAARLLEGREEPDIVQALCQALTDREQHVRAAAAYSLSQLKTAAAGYVLVPWLQHPEAGVRSCVLRALRELRLPESAQAALAALRDDDARVRREAVGVLGWLKHAPALPELARLAGEDPVVEVRRAAVGALGMDSGSGVLTALHNALNDSAWQVREEAANTLGKLRFAESGRNLMAALADSYWQVRLQAARALGRLRYAPAAGALVELLTHGIGNLRREAALALGELGSRSALPALRAAENDGDPDVRKAARIALTQLNDPTA